MEQLQLYLPGNISFVVDLKLDIPAMDPARYPHRLVGPVGFNSVLDHIAEDTGQERSIRIEHDLIIEISLPAQLQTGGPLSDYTIILADDHALMCEGIRNIIEP